MKLYPFIFQPEGMTQPYLWGGRRLLQFGKGVELANDIPIAESWEISDRSEDDKISVIANGPLAGKNLSWLVQNHRDELLGNARTIKGKFPLLIKFIDAQEQLSVQVHPTEDVAAKLNSDPKTESWYVLPETTQEAYIYAGFDRSLTTDQITPALYSGQLENLLHKIPVSAGDFLFIPSGRIHSIGAGCFILEIQQNSNTTYRVYDWNRVDPKTNQKRSLHAQEALQSLDLTDIRPKINHVQSQQQLVLTQSLHFTVEKWSFDQTLHFKTRRSFEIIVNLADQIRLLADNIALVLNKYQTCLVPASIRNFQISGNNVKLVRIYQ